MYENYKLCDRLRPSEICLVVEQYDEGKNIRKFHQHVAKSRLSRDARINLLRTLVLHFSRVQAETIVRCYLNARARVPSADERLRIVQSYPEAGVIRFYCGSDTVAWSDQVIIEKDFRQEILKR